MTIKAIFHYEIAEEKQEEYLKFVREELRPFFIAKGAKDYNVYQFAPLPPGQRPAPPPEQSKPPVATLPDTSLLPKEGNERMTFIAEFLFDNDKTMANTLRLHQTDPEYQSMINRFVSFVSEGTLKIGGRFVQKI